MAKMIADLILYNAKVLTLNPQLPQVEAVAIKGERILALGSKGDMEPLLGVETRALNCGGKTLIPGFIDAHCHILAYGQSLFSLNLSKLTSISEIKEAIYRQALTKPPGTWIVATGYDDFRLSEGRHPNRWDLDEVTPHHPVRLIHRSGHASVLNSLALSLVGITIETAEPPGGMIERDWETGEPNGILFGMSDYIRDKIPPMTEEELEQALSLANASFLSWGLTSLQDASATNDLSQWQLFSKLKEEGKLSSRINLMIGYPALDDFIEAGFTQGYGDTRLRLGGVKVTLEETTGELHPPKEEVQNAALKAQRQGFQLAFHCVEEGTVEAALSVLEFIGGKPLARHRLEHCSICPPALLSRMKGLGVVVVTQPPFLYYSGDRYLTTVPSHQFPWLYSIRNFFQEGIIVAGSSDAPVASPNPLIGIYAAVNRKAETGEEVLVHQAISPWQALKAYTINAAYAAFEEEEKGSIEVGKLADLVLLSQDPTQITPQSIKEIKVEMTILGGKVVYAI